MSEVYLARDPVLKRNVAVKLLSPRLGVDPEARRRFAREAEAAAAVAHPGVVPIHHVGTLPRSGLSYIVMAHIDGPAVRDLFPRGGAAPESAVRRLMAEVASALAAAHARGVVHRDIKPGNVMLDPGGGRFVVVDFGISAVLSREAQADRLTEEGVYLGTPAYMSPEQLAGDEVNGKSDVYSLGCLAYELLAGSLPIPGATPMALAAGHLHVEPVPIRSHRPELSPDLSELVMRCLRKRPADRPQADEIARALGLVPRATIEWPPPGLERLQRRGASWTRAAGGFAGALLLFVLVLGVHPTAGRPCCAGQPDHSWGWLVLKQLSRLTPVHFDDPDALSIWYFLLDAAFLVVLATLAIAGWRTAGVSRAIFAGRSAGYPWPVLGRVGWDRHNDTAQLINGTGRFALVPEQRRALLLRARSTANWVLVLSVVLLGGGAAAWLAGLLATDAPLAGLLSPGELARVTVPPALGLIGFALLEGLDARHRRAGIQSPRRGTSFRADVLHQWSSSAGVAPAGERWSRWLAPLFGIGLATAAGLVVTAAAFALGRAFSATARLAQARSTASEWLAGYRATAGAGRLTTPIGREAAMALVAVVPIPDSVVDIVADTSVPGASRRALVESVEPAFCLNAREVLFGVSRDRAGEARRLARIVSGPARSTAATSPGEAIRSPTPRVEIPVELATARQRARFCAALFGGKASTATASVEATGSP
jgi:hypothetical protein